MRLPTTIIDAASRIDIRGNIDHLADLGWLIAVWTLKKWLLDWHEKHPSSSLLDNLHRIEMPRSLSYADTVRFHHQLELLHNFLTSTPYETDRWSREMLVSDLDSTLDAVKKSFSQTEWQSFSIYDEVSKWVKLITPDTLLNDVLPLLDLADECFSIMTELEDIPLPQPSPL